MFYYNVDVIAICIVKCETFLIKMNCVESRRFNGSTLCHMTVLCVTCTCELCWKFLTNAELVYVIYTEKRRAEGTSGKTSTYFLFRGRVCCVKRS